jgi:hypothetical protein
MAIPLDAKKRAICGASLEGNVDAGVFVLF